jgi:methyl-accepting chemotaxis protein
MYPEEEKMHALELKVGLLEKDVQQTDRVCEKLSESIEKIQEMNDNMIRMLTIHEQRHEQHEKSEDNLQEDIKELHSRITTVSREIHERIDQVEVRITERLDNIRADLIRHKQEDNGNKISDTLKEIDKYKWMILGAAIALGWVIGNVNLGVLGTLFK